MWGPDRQVSRLPVAHSHCSCKQEQEQEQECWLTCTAIAPSSSIAPALAAGGGTTQGISASNSSSLSASPVSFSPFSSGIRILQPPRKQRLSGGKRSFSALLSEWWKHGVAAAATLVRGGGVAAAAALVRGGGTVWPPH